MLGNFLCCHLLTFFKLNFFKKFLSGILSQRQTVWIQIRLNSLDPDQACLPDLSPICLQRLSADDKSCRLRVVIKDTMLFEASEVLRKFIRIR